jgi:hypothetical protein
MNVSIVNTSGKLVGGTKDDNQSDNFNFFFKFGFGYYHMLKGHCHKICASEKHMERCHGPQNFLDHPSKNYEKSYLLYTETLYFVR